MVDVREDREVDDPERLVPPSGGSQTLKSSPIRGVITMLPALSETQTGFNEGRRSARPDSRMWWAR